jgi:nucleoside-diphosphate-sugar epimerase
VLPQWHGRQAVKRKCAVTGAGGYVGSRIVAYMQAHGWDVLALTRSRGSRLQAGSASYSLEDGISSDTLQGIDALIHCAYDFQPVTQKDIWRINVEGTARLFAAAHKAAVDRIVCVSTISAYAGCRSLYGKAKLAIEEEARKVGGVVVRPGLVYGREAGGMVGSLNRKMASTKVVPLIGNGSWMLYLSFDDDLCELIYRLCQKADDREHGLITAASSHGKSFRELLSDLALAHGKAPVFFSVPWRMVWLGLRLLETAGIRVNFRSDSVLGLVYPNPRPSFRELHEFGMTFRNFNPGLLE